MSTRAVRAGISALFDPADTPHARTFLRALNVAVNCLPAVARMQMEFLDDGASPSRAVQVAPRFVAAGVDVVVGHFSSDAAQAAADIYARAGIAVLTPAATLSALTRNRSNVFRLCPPDALLARRLLGFVRSSGWQGCSVECDDSAHGRALAQDILREADTARLLAPVDSREAEVAVFAGRLGASRQYLLDKRRKGHRGPIVLTDDAASPHLLAGVPDPGPVFVLSFTPARWNAGAQSLVQAHVDLFGCEPEVYFIESIAALSAAAALDARAGCLQQLQNQTFATPLGSLGFRDGELQHASHTVWRAADGALDPWLLLSDSPT